MDVLFGGSIGSPVFGDLVATLSGSGNRRGHEASRSSTDKLGARSTVAREKTNLGSKHRTVCRVLYTGFFPDLVSNLPAKGTTHYWRASRLEWDAPVYCSGLRGASCRVGLRRVIKAHWLAQSGQETADNIRALRSVDDHARELFQRKCSRDRNPLLRLLLSGDGWPWVGGDLRDSSQRIDRCDRWNL